MNRMGSICLFKPMRVKSKEIKNEKGPLKLPFPFAVKRQLANVVFCEYLLTKEASKKILVFLEALLNYLFL